MTSDPNPTRIVAGALLRGEPNAAPRLVVRSGPDAGRTLSLGPSQTLGRGRAADLQLSDPAASRLHLRLTRVGGAFAVADLQSKNGLLVNGEPCRQPLQLEVGDELAIGATRLTLEPGLLDAPPDRDAATGPPEPSTQAPAEGRSVFAGLAPLVAALALASAALLLCLP